MLSRLRLLPLLVVPLLAVLAACTGGSTASPSTATSPSAAGSPSPSLDASPSESGDVAGASGSPAASGSEADVEIVGVEYAFENVPETAASGTSFSFRNDGEELHEMVVVKRNEGVPDSFEDILEMPEQEALLLVSIVGGAIAEPGETAEETVTVEEAGDYLMVCFVPVGMTALPSPGESMASDAPTGPPHFTRGMLAEFTVD